MKITFLGTGSVEFRLDRYASSGILLEVEDKKILLDMGNGIMRTLLECAYKTQDIDWILFTHFHADHTEELIPYLLASQWGPVNLRIKDLQLWGNGINNFYTKLINLYPSAIPKRFSLALREVMPNQLLYNNKFKIISYPVQHIASSVAYVIEHNDKKLVYTGDTGSNDILLDFLDNADLAILECSLPEDAPEGIKTQHLTPSSAAELAQKANVKKQLFILIKQLFFCEFILHSRTLNCI